jgi:hypothetical protein
MKSTKLQIKREREEEAVGGRKLLRTKAAYREEFMNKKGYE